MAYDFPASPTIGQLYPVSPPPGAAQFKWDGQAWVAASPSGPSIVIPSGTVMLFYQAAAPLGWTKQTTHNDKALRVVSGAGGGAGGSNPFSTVMAQSVTGNHTLVAAEMPNMASSSGSITITVNPGGNPNLFAPVAGSGWAGLAVITTASSNFAPVTGTSVTYVSAFSGTNTIASNTTNDGGQAHSHPITMGIQYLDVILASKD